MNQLLRAWTLIFLILLLDIVVAEKSTFTMTVLQSNDGTARYQEDHARVMRTQQEVRDQFDALHADVKHAIRNPRDVPESIKKSFGEEPNLPAIDANLQRMKHMNLKISNMRAPENEGAAARANVAEKTITLADSWHDMTGDKRARMITHEASHIEANTVDWFVKAHSHVDLATGRPTPQSKPVLLPGNYGELRNRPDLKPHLVMGYHWFHPGRNILLSKEGSKFTHMNADSYSVGGYHAKYKGSNALDREVARTQHVPYEDASGWHFLTGQAFKHPKEPTTGPAPAGTGHPSPPPPNSPWLARTNTVPLPDVGTSSGPRPSSHQGRTSIQGSSTRPLGRTTSHSQSQNRVPFPSQQEQPPHPGPLSSRPPLSRPPPPPRRGSTGAYKSNIVPLPSDSPPRLAHQSTSSQIGFIPPGTHHAGPSTGPFTHGRSNTLAPPQTHGRTGSFGSYTPAPPQAHGRTGSFGYTPAPHPTHGRTTSIGYTPAPPPTHGRTTSFGYTAAPPPPRTHGTGPTMYFGSTLTQAPEQYGHGRSNSQHQVPFGHAGPGPSTTLHQSTLQHRTERPLPPLPPGASQTHHLPPPTGPNPIRPLRRIGRSQSMMARPRPAPETITGGLHPQPHPNTILPHGHVGTHLAGPPLGFHPNQVHPLGPAPFGGHPGGGFIPPMGPPHHGTGPPPRRRRKSSKCVIC